MTNEIDHIPERGRRGAFPLPDGSSLREQGLAWPAAAEERVGPSDRLWREHEQALDLDLRRIIRSLWARKWLFGSIFFGIMLLAGLIVFSIPHGYTATATVLIDPSETSLVDIRSISDPLSTTEESIASEIEVIAAGPLVERVIDAVGFREHLAAPSPPTPVGTLLSAILPRETLAATQDWATTMFDRDAWTWFSPEGGSEEEDGELDHREVLKQFYRGLDVQQVGETHVIRISFEATDPVLATDIANQLARAYVDSQLETKEQARTRAAQLLRGRLTELRERLVASEAAVEKFRNESGLVESAGVELVSQQISEQTTQLVEARAQLQTQEAHLKEIQGLRAAGAFERLQNLVDPATIDRLQERAIDIRGQIARESKELGQRHPVIINLHAELDAVGQRLIGEVNDAVENLRVQTAVAAQRVTELERTIAGLKEEISGLSSKEGMLRQLEAEAQINRTLYETLLNRIQETEQAAFSEADARVLTPANIPIDPSAPGRRFLLALALVGAFCVSSGVVFGTEYLHEGFATEDELTKTVGLPTLAVVPRTSSRQLQSPGGFDRLIANYGSAYTESINALHTGLCFAKRSSREPVVIVVTSSAPGEGKSTLVSGLARVAAQLGSRVLAIDCDLRRPRLHACFGLDNGLGLSTYVRQASDYADNGSLDDDLVELDSVSGVHVITAGPTDENPQRILRSGPLTRLLAAARDAYDLILIDTPPVLAVVDPVIMASVADACLVVVKWRTTPRRSVVKALSRLAPSGAPVIGCVLTQVDRGMHKHRTYNYLEH
jgi:succinoglycan biosynthesis transport protein ExoP